MKILPPFSISVIMEPQIGSFSCHLLQLPHGEIINEFQNCLNTDRIGEALTEPKVLLQNQHGEPLLLKQLVQYEN